MSQSGAPAGSIPEVNGTFNGWCGNCNSMTDANGDGVWETTILLAEGPYEYKFSYSNWWTFGRRGAAHAARLARC